MACSASVSCSTGTGSAVTMACSSSSRVNTSGAIFTQMALPSQRSRSTTTRMPAPYILGLAGVLRSPRQGRSGDDPPCRRWLCSLPDILFNSIAEVAVDVAPVVEGALQHRIADAGPKMANDVVHQAFPLGVVHHVADQGAGLAPVVVLGAQRVGGAYHVAVGVPTGGLAVAGGVGERPAFGVGRVHRVGRQLVAHVAGGAVAVHGRMWCVDRQLVVVGADAVAVGVGVGAASAQ